MSSTKTNPYCNFCNTEIDNLTHIYVTCEKNQEFWIDIIRFINSMFPHIMFLNTIDIIFGTYMSDIHLLFFQQSILFTALIAMVISNTFIHI